MHSIFAFNFFIVSYLNLESMSHWESYLVLVIKKIIIKQEEKRFINTFDSM